MIPAAQTQTSVCQDCENGRHGLTQSGCPCACHWLNDVPAEPLGTTIDREQIADARADLGDWLDNAARQSADVLEQLRRALRDASKIEPVTAMVILPLIREQNVISQRLMELVQLRRGITYRASYGGNDGRNEPGQIQSDS